MSGEIEQSDVMYIGDPVATDGGEHHPDAIRLLKRAMRGRLLIAGVLMVVLGSIGVIGGYSRAKILYRSVAQVYVRPNLKPILTPSGTSQIPPMFSSYVRAQVSLLQSPDTIRMARDNLISQADGAASEQERSSLRGVATPIAMRDGLQVVHRHGEEVINVWFVHEDPVAAEAATNAVLAAYRSKHEERRKQGDKFRLDTLENRVNKAKVDADLAQLAIDEIGLRYGTIDLSLRHQALAENGVRLRARLDEIQNQILQSEALYGSDEASPNPAYPTDDGSPMSLSALARLDEELSRLVNARDATATKVDSLSSQFGPRHLVMKGLIAELGVLERRVNSRRSEVELMLAAGTPLDSTGAIDPSTDLPTLRALEATTQEQLGKVEEQLKGVFRDDTRLRDLRREHAGHLAKYEEALAALDRVNLDEIVSEQAGIVQTTTASTPSYPYSDKRRAYAILGGGGGAGLGLAIVVGWGLLNRRYNYIEDLSEPSFTAPLLGCLPEIGEPGGANDEVTAWSIHQIRNLLQAKVGERPDRGNLYTITSPQSGDGKTSLALALAISMAKSGKKTIIVDLDLVGRGLTKQLKLENASGVREAIVNEHVNGEISQTEVPGLSVLPAGRDMTVDESNLSSSRLQKIMSPLTERFDAVIIDTGPVLGSLESSLACGLADGVLVTISRGQSEALVEASLQRVRWLGAECVGLVFNRATHRDLRRSHSYSASRSMRSSAEIRQETRSRRALLTSAVGAHDAERVLGPQNPKKPEGERGS